MNLAIGFFDGVHLGHQRILEGADSVFTFENHPATVLSPAHVPPLLMDLDERVRCLKAIGVRKGSERNVHAVQFTREFASLSPAGFAEYLRGRFPDIDRIHCGANWRFGLNGAGTPDELRRHGFDVKVADCATYRGERISSTRIRRVLSEGILDDANAMLGRPFSVCGRIAGGKGVAKTLGAATLNVMVSAPLKPGVYAVRTDIGPGLANYGIAPTMGDKAWTSPVLEVHLFDGSQLSDMGDPDMLRVEFISFLRPERTFPSIGALRDQIAADVASARIRLADRSSRWGL